MLLSMAKTNINPKKIEYLYFITFLDNIWFKLVKTLKNGVL
jgi:hypothetical protein